MSKTVDWGLIHGEGEIVCLCDHCGGEEDISFYDGPDFKEAQRELEGMGWVSRKISGVWHDFCCEDCLRAYLKEAQTDV